MASHLTDRELVALLIGREPMGAFDVAVRRDDGSPVVLANQPLLETGRPMPTRFWLADRALNKAIGQLESTGAVNRAEHELAAEAIAATHAAAEAERELHLPVGYDGPRPSGGVGGTRLGVKCLHAHYANLLAGADDVVGHWVEERLVEMGRAFDSSQTGIVTDLARQAAQTEASIEESGTNEQTLNSQPQVVVESLAVIDLGSASTRMLLVNAEGVSSKYQATTAMAELLTASGKISIGALERVQEVLHDYRDRCHDLSITNITVVATAAARVATNVDDLASLVDSTFGVALRVLTDEEEGSLAFAGATAGQPDDTMVMLLDIGGASTEFVVGVTGTEQVTVVSVPMGAVSMSESYIVSDPPDPGGLSSALSVAATHVDDVIRSLPTIPNAAAHGVVIGVGGTITTTAAVEIGMPVYDVKKIQDFVLHKDAAEDVFRALATESHEDRAFNPGLEADRVPYIVGGLCVLVATMRHLVIDEIMVSDRDLLDGLKMEVLAR